jgi:hypothetical protein
MLSTLSYTPCTGCFLLFVVLTERREALAFKALAAIELQQAKDLMCTAETAQMTAAAAQTELVKIAALHDFIRDGNPAV